MDKLDKELRRAMLVHIGLQLQDARRAYALSRSNLSVEMQRWHDAKRWLAPASNEIETRRMSVTRALRIVNFARKRLLETIRYAEQELGKPKRQFFRPKRNRTLLERFEVTGAAA